MYIQNLYISQYCQSQGQLTLLEDGRSNRIAREDHCKQLQGRIDRGIDLLTEMDPEE